MQHNFRWTELLVLKTNIESSLKRMILEMMNILQMLRTQELYVFFDLLRKSQFYLFIAVNVI